MAPDSGAEDPVGQPGGLKITRVLVVEDDPQDAALYTAMLRSPVLNEQFEVVLVGRLSECVALLAGDRPACVLLDMGLPDADGVEGLARIRIVAPDVPVVVLTGTDDETVGVRALQSGAQDYLVKGQVGSQGLLRSIRYAIERMRADRRLHVLASPDPVTELANRAAFADRLQVALAPFETPDLAVLRETGRFRGDGSAQDSGGADH
jgi:DNA-binding response OmpR family regulator